MFSWLLANHASHKSGTQGQLGGCQTKRFTSQLFCHTDDFKNNLTWLNLSHVVLGIALTVTHAHFSRLLGNRLVRKHTNPDTTTPFNVTGNRTTRGFNLTGSQTTTVNALQTKITKRDRAASSRNTGVTALLLFAIFATSGLQHNYSPLPSAAAAGAATLRTRLTAGLVASAPVASAGLSLPSAGAVLPPSGRRSSSARGSTAAGRSLRPNVSPL